MLANAEVWLTGVVADITLKSPKYKVLVGGMGNGKVTMNCF